MKTVTKYYVKYKTNAKRINPFLANPKPGTYTIECCNEDDAMRYGSVMNYDNVKKMKIFSKTYIVFFNINIPIKEKNIFNCNIKSKK